MRRLAPLLLAALPAWAEPVSAPSGQRIELVEAFWDVTKGRPPTLRLRFLAPQLGDGLTFADVEADFLHLCRAHALPHVTEERNGSLIIINILDRRVPFGASDPEATQFFEAFRAENGDCVWQGL